MKARIHYKISLIFVFITAVILLGVFIYLNNHFRRYTFQRIESQLKKQAYLAETHLKKEDISSLEKADSIADRISRDLGVRTTIINLAGRVLGDSDLNIEQIRIVENHLFRPEVQDALEAGIGTNRRFSTTVKKDMLYIANLIGQNPPEGIVRLSMPLSEIQMISSDLKRILMVSLLCTFGLIAIASFFIAGIISRPIKEMAWIARKTAKGGFSQRIDVRSNDEVGILARSFNNMVSQVQDRIKEITASKSRLRAVLMSMSEGVLVTDAKGEVLLINQSLREFFNISQKVEFKRPIELIRNVEIQEMVDNILASQGTNESRQISVMLPEAKTLLVNATCVTQENMLEGAVLVFHDITELRRLEKVRKDFVANVSHELRTPVTTIKGYAETLFEGAVKDAKDTEDFIEIIYSESERLARLIDDILSLSRLESEQVSLSKKPCNIRPLIKKVFSGLRKQAEDKNINLAIEIKEKMPQIYVDEGKILQALLNLVDNAIKYNRSGGKVIVSVRKENDSVRITVADTGIGIPAKDMPRIFERFYRVEKARSRELGGTGLGLSIVKHIITLHRGRLYVESTEAQGTKISFTLPVSS